MALTLCTECNHQISDQAAACPHCGVPLGALFAGGPAGHPRSVGFLLGLGIFLLPMLFVWFLLRSGHSTLARVLGFGWFALFLLAAFGQGERSAPHSAPATAPAKQVQGAPKVEQPLQAWTARQIAAAYDSNTVAADQQFKGKRFKVSGVVDSINTDLFGNPYVTLRGGVNQFMEPQFRLKDDQTSYAASLRAGMSISLICIGKGDVAKTAISGDCVPAQ